MLINILKSIGYLFCGAVCWWTMFHILSQIGSHLAKCREEQTIPYKKEKEAKKIRKENSA